MLDVSGALVLALLLPLIPLVVERGKVLPIFIKTAFLGQLLVGYAILGEEKGDHLWVWYGLGIAALLVGYYVVAGRMRYDAIPRPPVEERTAVVRLWVMLLIVGGLALFHLAVVGAPLFSPEIEVARFGFSESGLLGIPGRMYLFGLLFMAMYTSVYYIRWQTRRTRTVFIAAWILYGGTQLLSGFKGSLLYLVTTALVIRALAGRPANLRKVLSLRYLLIIVAVFGYAGIVSLQYKSVGVSTAEEAVPYLIKRATTIPAEPGHLAMTIFDRSGEQSFLLGDLGYYLDRYFDLQIISSVPYPLELQVSSRLTDTPLLPGYFLVPVTVGAFPAFFVDWGLGWALFLIALLGALYAFALTRSLSARTPFRATAWAYGVQIVGVIILNGSLAYSAVNLVAMLGMLFFIDRIALVVSSLVGGPTSSPAFPSAHRVPLIGSGETSAGAPSAS